MHLLGFDGTNHRFFICLGWKRAQVAGCILLHQYLSLFVYDAGQNFSLELFLVGVISFGFGVVAQVLVASKFDVFELMLQRHAAHSLDWSLNVFWILREDIIFNNYGIEFERFVVIPT